MVWYNYILKSEHPRYPRSTYNGKTNDPKRRIRQHNGEIVGGAKATHNKRPWKFICLISGFVDERDALRCEWRIKHPNNKRKRPSRFCRPEGRLKGLIHVLQNCSQTGWTSNCAQTNPKKYSTQKIEIKVLDDYKKLFENIILPDFCVINFVESLP
jgi:predicted GIY-YIG superfamily endonuclease